MAIKNNTNAVLAESDRLIRQKLEIASLLVERTAKLPGYCPVKTGAARRTITHKIAPDGKSAKVGSNIEYFPIIEMGSRAHVIRPKTAKVLHFKVGGKDIFAKSVQHPGTPAYAPLRRSLETNMRKIKNLFGVK